MLGKLFSWWTKRQIPADPQPFFRFYPGAYDSPAIFERSEALCAHCQQPAVWQYQGSIYASNHHDAKLCARCVSAGGLEAFFGGRYGFHDIDLDGVAPALAREVQERTPGVGCFNPFSWPSINAMPMAYIGTGDDPAIYALPGVAAAISNANAELGWEDDGPSTYALIFREIDGPHIKAVIDLD
jgi:uncharacterized protein